MSCFRQSFWKEPSVVKKTHLKPRIYLFDVILRLIFLPLKRLRSPLEFFDTIATGLEQKWMDTWGKTKHSQSQEQSKRVALPKEATYVFEINRQSIALGIHLLRARNWWLKTQDDSWWHLSVKWNLTIEENRKTAALTLQWCFFSFQHVLWFHILKAYILGRRRRTTV